MKILALSTNYKYHQDVLECLRAEHGVIAEFATSHKPETEQENREYYSKYNTKLIDGKDFYLINRINKIIPASAPALDKATLDHFAHIERDYYILTDRYSYFPRSFRYRKRLFRAGLRFWLDFYARNKIDAVFSICAPHNLSDFPAFHVAQYLGIPTLMTTDVMINDHVLLLSDYREINKVPHDFMAGQSDDEVAASIPPKLVHEAFNESKFINFSKVMNDKLLKLENLNIDKKAEAPTTPKVKKKKEAFSAYTPRFKSNFAMNKQYSDFMRRLFRISRGLELRKLKKQYNDLAVQPDMSKKYVYFAMHLTPERTSQPEAEIFEDQLLAIDILSASVPGDWLIYVKENPAQYTRRLNLVNGKGFRDESDYGDFLRRPNVRLIQQNIKTVDLIKSAAVVSTLKGSVGWESLGSGKPCIIFANAFYSACRSAYRVGSVDECKAAIAEIGTKTPENVRSDILRYLSYMQEKLIIGNMGGHESLSVAGETYESLVGSLATELVKGFNLKR